MKKLISLIAAAAMLLALAAPVFAAEDKPTFVLTGPESANVGDTVTYTLSIHGTYSVHIINLRIFFDNTSLEYVGRKYNDVAYDAGDIGGNVMCALTMDGKAVSLGITMIGDPLEEEGDIVTITFNVLPTAQDSAFLAIGVKEFAVMPIGEHSSTPVDYATQNLTVRLSGGTGSTTTPAPTDVPGPGKVTETPDTSAKPTETSHTGSMTPVPTATPASGGQTPAPTATPVPGTEVPTQEPDITPRPMTTNNPTEEPETTPVPAETATPAPEVTPAPEDTPDPDATPDPNETAAPIGTFDPDATLDPGQLRTDGADLPSERPDGSDSPEATEDPNAPAPKRNGAIGWLIGGGAVLAAGAAAAVVILTNKKKKEEK